jgi:hypothetical protein
LNKEEEEVEEVYVKAASLNGRRIEQLAAKTLRLIDTVR